jgi:asparagine synthase (glutamine-hydrolysing)
MAAADSEKHLSWDIGAIMSTLSLGYALGDSTLFTEIRRRPWLGQSQTDGSFRELQIPPHGRYRHTSTAIAEQLYKRLQNEIEVVSARFSKIYLLLSGGLDSRIVAGVVRALLDQGRIHADVTAITWGQPFSRDVVLAKEVAENLGFRWQHIVLSAGHLEENIEITSRLLGASVSPINLHRMNWLIENCEPTSLVLAGSYGDSVGRGEYSRRTVLELDSMKPFNAWGLIRNDLSQLGAVRCKYELDSLSQRAGSVPGYVLNEHQQQAHYMRGLIAQTMSVINTRCHLYQAFTAPDVYQFMWSLHPSTRTDDVYIQLLKNMGNDLVKIPWARDNRSPDRTRRDHNELLKNYHDYPSWTNKYISQQFEQYGYENYLESFRVLSFLDQDIFCKWVDRLVKPDYDMRNSLTAASSAFLWLESLKRVSNRLKPSIEISFPQDSSIPPRNVIRSRSHIRRILSSIPWLRDLVSKSRRLFLRLLSRWQYPFDTK